MVKVLKRCVKKLIYTCENCGSVMSLDESDIKVAEQYPYQSSYWFDCPVCKRSIRSAESIKDLISKYNFEVKYIPEGAEHEKDTDIIYKEV